MTDQADTPDPIGLDVIEAELRETARLMMAMVGSGKTRIEPADPDDGVGVAWIRVMDAAAIAAVVRVSEQADPCRHDSCSGDEGPVRDLPGGDPVRWCCDGCGAIVYSDASLARLREQLRSALAELAAARDREAAVLAMHPKQTTHLSGGGGVLSDSAGFNARAAQFLGLPVEYCGRCQNPEVQRWPCATVAALSQSEPTKETP